MGRMSRHELLGITTQVEDGELTAAAGINKITFNGESKDILVVGTAISSPKHYPMPAYEAHEPRTPEGRPYWNFRLPYEQGEGGEPILRAGSVASTAIMSAFGGDINFPQQRLRQGKLLTSPGDFYHGPTYGWEYNKSLGAYDMKIHEAFLDGTAHIPDEEIIGAADLVEGEGFTIQIPDEPGHYGSYDVHDRIGSLPVRMRDIRDTMAVSAFRLIRYEPLPA